MVTSSNQRRLPLGLVVTGEAESWLPALELIVGPDVLLPYKVSSDAELLETVRSGQADAAVIDDEAAWVLDVMQILRMIRKLNTVLPVVVVTSRRDRRVLEDALRLMAFSVVAKPLALEELLRQIHRIMARLDRLW